MKAELLMDDRYELDDRSFAELVVWRRADGSIKYRLAFVVDDDCVLRHDNETGKVSQLSSAGNGHMVVVVPGTTAGSKFRSRARRSETGRPRRGLA